MFFFKILTLCEKTSHSRFINIKPKLSDSPYFTRAAGMPQTLLECDTLNIWAIDLKSSPNR